MFSDPESRIATAEELVESMQAARIDRSIALGHGWTDENKELIDVRVKEEPAKAFSNVAPDAASAAKPGVCPTLAP